MQDNNGNLVDAVDPIWDGEAVDISTTDHTFSKYTRSVYVGTGGTLIVTTVGGTSLTYLNVQDGSFLPIRVKSVTKTGTTASDILGLW